MLRTTQRVRKHEAYARSPSPLKPFVKTIVLLLVVKVTLIKKAIDKLIIHTDAEAEVLHATGLQKNTMHHKTNINLTLKAITLLNEKLHARRVLDLDMVHKDEILVRAAHLWTILYKPTQIANALTPTSLFYSNYPRKTQ